MILAGIMGYLYYRNKGTLRHNPYAILLSIYFTVLLFFSSDPSGVRANYTASVVFFLSIPLIYNIYKMYGRSFIESEIYKMCLIILLLFISNTVLATLTGYTGGGQMYRGVTGIWYGHLSAADFNIIPVALFFLLYKLSKKYSTSDILIAIVSFGLVVLSMRRSIMVAAIVSAGIFALMLLFQRNISNFIITTFTLGMFIIITLVSSDVLNKFWERYEARGLHEREFVSTEEGRFIEYELVYSDIFIHKRYSPITGYELFNSSGNYGGGVHKLRSLHSDITVIIHGSGLLGLFLYLLMTFKSFKDSFMSALNVSDLLILLFCAAALIIFSLTGRFTMADHMITTFLVLLLPMSNRGTV